MQRTFAPALLLLGTLAFAGLTLGPAARLSAQAPEGPDTTESTTEDSTGTVVSVDPYFTITVTDRKGPFTYRLGQDVRIFGPDDRPLKITEVLPGDEATVFYYYRDNHPTVARLVILRHGKLPAKK